MECTPVCGMHETLIYCVYVRQCPSLGTELCTGSSPAFRELTAGVGADSARLYRVPGFYCMCPNGKRRGHSGVFSLYFLHLTCASQLVMVQFLQDELVSGPRSVPSHHCPLQMPVTRPRPGPACLPKFYPPSNSLPASMASAMPC